ncbi:MAG TPA: glycosyltransferase [Tangfeifania sp.]|nr:glycosyltransferase [Tangfeifania sp.]
MVDFILNAFAGFQWYDWALLGFFGLLYLLKLLYLFLFTGRILYRRKSAQTNQVPLSLLLTYRNEEENLTNYLPQVLESLNPGSEVVAVDDYSQDNSLSVLGVLRESHSNLKVSALNQETRYSEKMAQNIALKAASNSWVMVIPPSHKVNSPEWLSAISSKINNEKEIIINYSNVKARKGFFQLLYRNERLFQQLKSFGFILNRLSYLSFEENIAFRKEKYFEAGGFGQHIKEHFANLELVLNDFIKKKKTAINFTSETTIQKEMNVSKPDYFELLKKELRIRQNLSFSKRFILFCEKWLTLLFFSFTVFTVIYFMELWPVISGLVLLYIVAFAFIIKISLNRLNERNLFLSSLVYALFIPVWKAGYQVYFQYKSRRRQK